MRLTSKKTGMWLSAFFMLAVVATTNTATAQIIGDTGEVVTGAEYDWDTGRWEIKKQQQQIFKSALDPNRNQVDPGSYQDVDYFKTDASGVTWHYTGARWTSYGKPHSNITREATVDNGNGITIDRIQQSRAHVANSYFSTKALGSEPRDNGRIQHQAGPRHRTSGVSPQIPNSWRGVGSGKRVSGW